MLLPDVDTCYRAVQSRDPRFDGWFVTAVRTTGIYCRPSCPAITPQRRNVSFHPSAAAAQHAGYRACKRCRPDASPGSPEWDSRGDLAGRALRLIADGVVDRDGVPGLASRLGYSPRQVQRALVAEVGAGPLSLARAQRAQTARVLLETSDLPVADVAFAAGFASVRQFNETVQEVFATTPLQLRHAGGGASPGDVGVLSLRLAYRAPMDVVATLDFLGAHAVRGLESYDGVTFTRVICAPHAPATVALSPGDGSFVRCEARLGDARDLVAVVARVRRLLDLDADAVAIDEVLGHGRDGLAAAVAARPGLRSPGTVDGFETAVRTVVGQQISLDGARAVLARIVAEHGSPVDDDWRLFPAPDVLAGLDAEQLPMPRARGRAVIALARAAIDGLRLDAGCDRDETSRRLLVLPGIGPWTTDYLRMRAMADPDVLLAGDLGVKKAAAALGVALLDGRPDWSPWRSYATHHVWASMFAAGWRARFVADRSTS